MAQAHENLTRDEAAGRVAVVREPVYAIHLDLTRGDDDFGSRVEVRFGATAGTSTFIDCTARSVERVVLNGTELSTDAVAETRIALDGLEAQNVLVVESTMAYTREGRGLHHFRDPGDEVVYLHSQFEPFDAHTVFACFDQPDLKATYTLAVDAPVDWVVVSNMPVTESPADGAAGTWRFAPTPLLSSYLVAIVAGGYEVIRGSHGDVELGIYARRSLIEHVDADEIFALTGQGLDWFAEAFDLPYPFGKYDQLFVPEFAMGAMEHPGCVTFTETYVFRSKVTDSARERRAETILHEMAHMWFGDLVTMKWWDDLWLNESFATFMSVLALVEATRFDNAWVTFLDAEKAWAKYQDQLPTTHPIAADAPDVETANQNFDGITYAKGASVLRQLVAWVGQDAFLEGCREYFRMHAWSNATLADFLGALEKASGRDLDAWRDEWLMTTGVNTLAATRPEGDLCGPITITQIQGDEEPAPRRHRIRVGLYRGDDVIRRYADAEVDLIGESIVIDELADQPAPDLLVINDADLTYAKVVLDPASTATATERLGSVEDPLARASVWATTWDMVRDGQLPARRYAEQVVRNAGTETEVGVLQRLLARASAAIDRYGAPENRAAAMVKLSENARRELDAAEPGSDHQLAWLRHWSLTSRSGQQLEDVAAVLDGSLEIPGASLDTDMRWHLVTSLASVGAVDVARIEEELLRDPTDLGERAAAAARASLPDPDEKRSAWERLVASEDLSHTMARELYRGFGHLHQDKLLASFREPYFAVLPTIATSRGMDVAVEFVEATFPHATPDQALLHQLDEHLAGDELPGPIRRALLEQRDQLQRTMAARQLDATA